MCGARQGSDPQDDALRTAIRAVQDIGQLFVTAAGAALGRQVCVICRNAVHPGHALMSCAVVDILTFAARCQYGRMCALLEQPALGEKDEARPDPRASSCPVSLVHVSWS